MPTAMKPSPRVMAEPGERKVAMRTRIGKTKSTADVNAFRIPGFTKELKDRGFIPCGGFLLEIALHEILGPVEPRRLPAFASEDKRIAALIEAEGDPSHTRSSSPYSGFGQVTDYLKRRDFINQAFVCGPICSQTHEEIGTISFMADGTLFSNAAKILPRNVSGICSDVEAFIRKLLEVSSP